MKKIAFLPILALITTLHAQDLLPPTPPNVKLPALPKECSSIPPMILFLPPPLEAELHNCKVALNIPDNNTTSDMLQKNLKKKLTITAIRPLFNSENIFEIEYMAKNKKESIICNKTMDSCIKNYERVNLK